MFFHVTHCRRRTSGMNAGMGYFDSTGRAPDVDGYVNGVHPTFTDEIARSTNGDPTEWMDG